MRYYSLQLINYDVFLNDIRITNVDGFRHYDRQDFMACVRTHCLTRAADFSAAQTLLYGAGFVISPRTEDSPTRSLYVLSATLFDDADIIAEFAARELKKWL